MGHFDAIGMPMSTPDEFRATIVGLIGTAVSRAVDRRVVEHVWTDASGARCVVETHGEAIEQVLPCLAGSAVPARARHVRMADAETAVLELVDADGEMICPAAVELEDRAVLVAAGGVLAAATVVLSALAEEITVHADAQAYDASQDADGAKLGPNHFIPAGMFGDGVPTAHAMFAGHVLEATRQTNTLTGAPFHRLRVSTIDGIHVDVAVAADAMGEASLGNIVAGTFFMTGRLGIEPKPVKRGWFRR